MIGVYNHCPIFTLRNKPLACVAKDGGEIEMRSALLTLRDVLRTPQGEVRNGVYF